MKKEEFITLIKEYQDFNEKVDEISDVLGCDFFESSIIDYTQRLFDIYLKSIFDEEDVDTIYWWLFERPNLDKECMWEGDKAVPTETIDDLWNIVKHDSL